MNAFADRWNTALFSLMCLFVDIQVVTTYSAKIGKNWQNQESIQQNIRNFEESLAPKGQLLSYTENYQMCRNVRFNQMV